jgi:hypothetical protein
MVTWLHCFWACGEARDHDREHKVEQRHSSHGIQKEDRGRVEGQAVPFKGIPSTTHIL